MSLDLEFHLHIFQPFIYVSIIAFSGCPLCVPCTAKSELGLMDQTAIEVGPGVDTRAQLASHLTGCTLCTLQ